MCVCMSMLVCACNTHTHTHTHTSRTNAYTRTYIHTTHTYLLKQVEIKTGRVLRKHALSASHFGEGCTLLKGEPSFRTKKKTEKRETEVKIFAMAEHSALF